MRCAPCAVLLSVALAAVQEGMMAGAFGEVRAGEEVSTVRVDIRQHTRSAAIVVRACQQLGGGTSKRC